MRNFRKFLARKNIVFSVQRYFIDGLSAMAIGLFSTLIIGLIIETIGNQLTQYLGENQVFTALSELGKTAKSLQGVGIGIAVSHGLKAPPLVMFSGAVTGTLGATLGGPAGAFIAAAIGCEFGKAVSKETKIDIIVTPAVTLLVGLIIAQTIGPAIGAFMNGLGSLIESATELQPFFMGIVIAVLMGIILTAPLSSAALAIMLGLDGLAGGAATVGCSAQMVGFAVISYRENKAGGLIAQGIGTSMLQVPNIVKNFWIIIPPILSSAVLGPLSTIVFQMKNNPEGSGMGTSGLVGQINTLNTMGYTWDVLLKIILLHFILPAILSYLFYRILRKLGKIKYGDMKLDL